MLSELKKLGRHTIIYGAGFLLGKAIGFFLIPLYTHYLTPSDYGILELLDLTGYIIGFFLSMGLSQAILRYYNHYEGQADKDSVISTALFFSVLSGGIIITFLFNFAKHFSQQIFGSTTYAYLFTVLFVNVFLGSLLELTQTTLRAQQKSVHFTIISLVYVLIAILLNIYFIAILKLGVKGILYSVLITSLLITVYLLFQILRQTGLSFHSSKLLKMLKYGLPFIPTGLLMFILNWSDRYILKMYHSTEMIGLYALGYKMGMIIVFLISVPFKLIWSAYMFEIEKQVNSKEIFSKVFTYYVLALVFAGLLISVLSREIIVIMSPPSYFRAHEVIPLIVLSMIFLCSDNVLQAGILIKRKTFYLPPIVGIAAATNILLNFILIPQYGMIGAAIATALSFFLYILIVYCISQRLLYIRFELNRISKLCVCALIVFAFSSFIGTQNLWLSIPTKLSLLFGFLFFLVLVKFPDKEEVKVIKDQLQLLFKKTLKRFPQGFSIR